jgi:tetratricopeptide (TPR) repeat protein
MRANADSPHVQCLIATRAHTMDDVATAKVAGDAAHRAGRFADAEQHYSAALELCARRCEQRVQPETRCVLYSNRAAARLAQQPPNHRGALADAQAAVAVDDTWVKGWYRSAKALQGLQRWQPAVEAATKALQLDPSSKQVGGQPRSLGTQWACPHLTLKRHACVPRRRRGCCCWS